MDRDKIKVMLKAVRSDVDVLNEYIQLDSDPKMMNTQYWLQGVADTIFENLDKIEGEL